MRQHRILLVSSGGVPDMNDLLSTLNYLMAFNASLRCFFEFGFSVAFSDVGVSLYGGNRLGSICVNFILPLRVGFIDLYLACPDAI